MIDQNTISIFDQKADQKIDHDRLFKELLTTFFTEFVALFLTDSTGFAFKKMY